MKKPFQIFILLLFSLSVFAQEKKDTVAKGKERNRWSIQLQGGTNYCFPGYQFTPDREGKGQFEYGFSFQTSRMMIKYFYLNLGFSYNYLKYTSWYSYSPYEVSYFDHSFLSFVFSTRIHTNPGKVYGSIEIGITGDYLLDNHFASPFYVVPRKAVFFPNHTMTSSFYIAPGINYNINKHFAIDLVFGFTKAIIPLKYFYITAGGSRNTDCYYYSHLNCSTGLRYIF